MSAINPSWFSYFVYKLCVLWSVWKLKRKLTICIYLYVWYFTVIPKVKQWAPKIWFDPQEKFFPLNVDSFLKEITPEEKNGQKYSDDSYSKLPTGPNSKNYYLITKQNRGKKTIAI